MKFINYMGSNGSGKSTRTRVLVEYLKSKYEYKELIYPTKSKGTRNVGYIFDNGWFILGAVTKNSWVGFDRADFTKNSDRKEFLVELKNKYNIKVAFMEGYFNNRSEQMNPDELHNIGIEELCYLVSYYDNIEEFIERTNNRTGKTRGIEWAENSSGWGDNKQFKKILESFSKKLKECDEAIRLDIYSPENILVSMFFDETFEWFPPETEKDISVYDDEW